MCTVIKQIRINIQLFYVPLLVSQGMHLPHRLALCAQPTYLQGFIV